MPYPFVPYPCFFMSDHVGCTELSSHCQQRQRQSSEHRSEHCKRYVEKLELRFPATHHCPGLESKQSTLVEVVQSLREYIEDEDATIRSRTVGYLSQVIGELPPTFLPRQQIEVLCQFFCGTIEDDGAVGGLQKLQYLSRFNKEMVAMTFRA